MVFALVLNIYRNSLLLLFVGLGGCGWSRGLNAKRGASAVRAEDLAAPRGASRRTLGRRSYPQTGLLKKSRPTGTVMVRELPSVPVLVEGFCQGGPALGALAKSPSHHPYFDL